MADFANCPTCHGRGVVPLEEAERVKAHKQVSHSAAEEARREQERELNRADLEARLEAKRAEAARRRRVRAEIAQADVDRHMAEAEARLAKITADGLK